MDTTDTADTSLYFTDGHVVARDRILIAAKLNAHSEDDFSRVLYYIEDDWDYEDIDDSVHSVTFRESDRTCYWLGRHGLVISVKGGDTSEHRLKDANKYGYVNTIRTLGDSVYVCGYGGQIYRYTGRDWIHADRGVLVARPDGRSVDLQDLAGSGEDNMVAVGTGGAIFHFDGKRWTALDSPTNAHLLRVKCLTPDEFLISGMRGTLLAGGRKGWRDVSDPEITEDYWGLEVFKGDVYLAHATGIVRWDGKRYEDVTIARGRTVTCHRLHANDGVLWSFGLDDLFYFDGHRWEEILCPENTP